MANWWTPWEYAYNVDNPELNAYQFMNWFAPYMAPYESAAVGQYLGGIGAQGALPSNMRWQGYAAAQGAPTSYENWLGNVGQIGQAGLPAALADSPEGAWLTSLTGSAGALLKPGATREQQSMWGQTYQDLLGRAPSDLMRDLGTRLYSPTAMSAPYGASYTSGQFGRVPRMKGGLTGNPSYI